MYMRFGQPFDITVLQLIGETQYPAGSFNDPALRQLHGILPISEGEKPEVASNQKAVVTGYAEVANTWAQVWSIFPKTQEDVAAEAATLALVKAAKNTEINLWRAEANQTTFPHSGKLVSCDPLSRSDIDAVANHISLFGTFPSGFPGAWKAVDNSYIMLADVDAFKAMYTSMTTQGTTNFNHSQTLKGALAAATTPAQAAAITW